MAKTLTGIVASKKTDKTIVVSVQSSKTHPLYRKKYIYTKRFMAHDEKNDANEGDKVRITEIKPLSAKKRFALDKVLERALIRGEQSVEAITADANPQNSDNEKPAAKVVSKKPSVTASVAKKEEAK